MNSIKIDGNVTRDPETFSPQGSEYTVLKFSIANNDESKKDANGKWENVVSYFDVEHWTKNVQYLIQKLTKGAPVTVQGRIKQDRFEHEGQNRNRVKIIAEVGRNEGFAIVVHDRLPKQQTASSEPPPAEQFEDDIPF